MRLKAIVGISYPDASCLKMVQDAGGLSKLTDKQRGSVKTKYVKPGGYCDDIPEASRKNFIRFGYVEEVGSTSAASNTKPRTAKR